MEVHRGEVFYADLSPVVQPDNAATQGKIAKIGFMLSVTEA